MMEFQWAYLLILIVLLLVAARVDLRTRRIPNRLVVVGIVLGFSFQVLADHIAGVFPRSWGGHGLGQAFLGMFAGLGLFMPLYLIRGLGAGDVKLLAMVGAWLGPQGVFIAALMTMLIGGVMSLTSAAWNRVLREVWANVWAVLNQTSIKLALGQGLVIDAPAKTHGRLPYAVAIAAGTVLQLYVMARHLF